MSDPHDDYPRGLVIQLRARVAELEAERDARPSVRFDAGEKLLTIQWRKSRERGVMLLISGDGSAEYSVKRAAGDYYGKNGRCFALSDGWPQEMLNEIAALTQDLILSPGPVA